MGSEFYQTIYSSRRHSLWYHHGKKFVTHFKIEFYSSKAANYLGIKTLLAVGCKTIANMVRGKSSTEVRELFNISYDPPGEGLNAPAAVEGQSGTVPTKQDSNVTGPSPQPDPMN